jgi:hypothetical protein
MQLLTVGCLQTAFRRPQVASFTSTGHASRLVSVRKLYISGPAEDPSAGQVWRQIAAPKDGHYACLSTATDPGDADALLEVSANQPGLESRTVTGTLWSQDGEKLWWGSARQFVREAAGIGGLGIEPFVDELSRSVGCRSDSAATASSPNAP